MSPTPSHTPSPARHSTADERARLNTLQTISLLIAVLATLLTPLVYLTGSNPLEALTPALLAVTGWVALALLKRGLSRYVPHATTVAVLLAALISVLAFGSVRTTGSFIFVAVVAGAGTFMGRTALVATFLTSALLLGGLDWAEHHGWLHPASFTVGFKVWLTQVGTLLVVAILVYHSRVRARRAYLELSDELELRQRTEQERNRSLERFGRMFHSTPCAMVAQSIRTGQIIDANAAFERCYGYTRAQLQGHNDRFLWADVPARQRYVKQLLDQQHIDQTYAVALHADGREFDVLISSEVSDEQEDPLIISTVVDISDERRRQAQLRSLAGGLAVPTGASLFQPLTMHMALSIGADTVALGELDGAQGRVQTLSVWKDGQPHSNFAFDVAETNGSQALDQLELCVHNSGFDEDDSGLPAREEEEEYPTRIDQALRDEDGQPIGLLSAQWRQSTELTADSQALIAIFASRATAELLRLRSDRALAQLNATLEQRVAERTAELEKLNAELDSFAYSISHDLKSPLRAIDGFTQLLSESLDTRLNPEERRLMDRVLGATQRTATLMADLLALTRVSQQPLNIERINLSLMAQEELDQCLSGHPRAELQSRIELGLVTYADPQLTRLMLKSLVDNAVKYTRDQPRPLIEIGRVVHASSMPDGTAPAFFIRDNGVGFSMDHADQLFKPFQRLHMPSAGFDGTGVGLATVRRIVERHGGTIVAQASMGAGAEFQFSLGNGEGSASPAPCPVAPL